MNDKIAVKVPVYKWCFYVFIIVINVLIIISMQEDGIEGMIFILICSFIALVCYSNMLIKGASSIILDNNTVEIKLLFRKAVVVPLGKIYHIEKAGNRSKGGEYYRVKYYNGSFNTCYLSYRNSKLVKNFIEELQRRVDEAKKKVE